MLQPIFELLGVKEEDWRDVEIIRQDKYIISFTFKQRGRGKRYVKALLKDGQWQIVLDRASVN
jgi:hypothetical protein